MRATGSRLGGVSEEVEGCRVKGSGGDGSRGVEEGVERDEGKGVERR